LDRDVGVGSGAVPELTEGVVTPGQDGACGLGGGCGLRGQAMRDGRHGKRRRYRGPRAAAPGTPGHEVR
jgi:hypothetical protein